MSSVLPKMSPGKYRLEYDMSIWKNIGLYNERMKRDGKFPGMLPAGSEIRIGEVRYLSVSVWGRCQGGWICMYMNETAYVRQVGNG